MFRLQSLLRGVALIAAMLLGACAGQPAQQQPDQPSASLIDLPSIKKMILDNRPRLFKDPDSIRDAKISEPITCPGGGSNTCVCIELNARNAYGGYTGLEELMVHFRKPNTPEIFGGGLGELARPYCRGYVPFPELNARR